MNRCLLPGKGVAPADGDGADCEVRERVLPIGAVEEPPEDFRDEPVARDGDHAPPARQVLPPDDVVRVALVLRDEHFVVGARVAKDGDDALLEDAERRAAARDGVQYDEQLLAVAEDRGGGEGGVHDEVWRLLMNLGGMRRTMLAMRRGGEGMGDTEDVEE